MIRTCLQPIVMTTAGDDTNKIGRQIRGVAKGSPLNPILHNKFMDTYPQLLRSSVPGEHQEWNVDLYADEV